MLQDFVKLLRKRITERRDKAILENSTTPGLKPAHREHLVGKVTAYREVLRTIDELLRSRTDVTEEVDGEEDIDDRPRRSPRRRAAPWGAQ
jgi:hypothetical protein